MKLFEKKNKKASGIYKSYIFLLNIFEKKKSYGDFKKKSGSKKKKCCWSVDHIIEKKKQEQRNQEKEKKKQEQQNQEKKKKKQEKRRRQKIKKREQRIQEKKEKKQEKKQEKRRRKIKKQEYIKEQLRFVEQNKLKECHRIDNNCCVCADNHVEVSLLKCKHTILCVKCYDELLKRHGKTTTCPFCRTNIYVEPRKTDPIILTHDQHPLIGEEQEEEQIGTLTESTSGGFLYTITGGIYSGMGGNPFSYW